MSGEAAEGACDAEKTGLPEERRKRPMGNDDARPTTPKLFRNWRRVEKAFDEGSKVLLLNQSGTRVTVPLVKLSKMALS
jgi:hypothetical protein